MKTKQATYHPSVLDTHLDNIKKLLDNGVPVQLDAYLDGRQIIPRTGNYDLIFDGFSLIDTVNDNLMIRIFPNPNSFTCDKYVYTPSREETTTTTELHPAVQKIIKEHAHLKVIHEKLNQDFDLLSKENEGLEKKIKKKSKQLKQLNSENHSLNLDMIELKSSIPKTDLNGILSGVVQAVAENPNILNIFKKEQPLSGVDVMKTEDTLDYFISQHFSEEEKKKLIDIITLLATNKKFIDVVHKYTQ